VRKAFGRRLARKAPVEADLVTGVPTPRFPPQRDLLKKRGFPTNGLGEEPLHRAHLHSTRAEPEGIGRQIKLNPLRSLIEGKRVVLVDDSIVRGTTSRHIIGLLRSEGAREVHVRISSPPYRFPCYYGIDTPSACELPAATLNVESIRERIGADSLVYLDLQDISDILGEKVSGSVLRVLTATTRLMYQHWSIPTEGMDLDESVSRSRCGYRCSFFVCGED
jgi:amidophosphoribosyltransferase